MTTTKFSKNDIVHNSQTNEDGKIQLVHVDAKTGAVTYEVNIPVDPTSWMMGTKDVTFWKDSEVEASTNEGLVY